MNTKDSIMKLIDGAKTFVIATDKGTGVVGEKTEVLTILTILLQNLKENGVSKESLNLAVNLAFDDEEAALKEFEREIDNRISSLIDEALKGLKDKYARK